MKKLFSVIILFSQFILSQEQTGPRICGVIIDAETREPIPYANIFISNSSIGCASDKNGYFELRYLPYGRFEIIGSVIGYEILKAKIGIYNDSRRTFRFEMYKQPIQFPEVIVSAQDLKKRKRQLRLFRKNLLGTSKNGKKTFIKYEDVIQFTGDEYTVLNAYAYEPLEIINNSLGYKIDYVLEDFELTQEYVKYTGYPYFNEKVSTTYHDSIDWPENRKNTYTGSLRHFLTAICENFEITNGDTTTRIVETDTLDATEFGVKVDYGDTTYLEDQGFYVIQIDHPYSKSNRRLLNTNWFLSEADNPIEMYLQFDDFLEVRYENEYFPFRKSYGSRKNKSWINMTCDSTILDKKGRYFDIYAIKTTGIWSQERVADMLPFDYTISK